MLATAQWTTFSPWASNHAAALDAIFAGTIAVATIASVAISMASIRETRAMRVAQFEPHVAIGLEQRADSPHFLDLVVRNEGGGPAFDIAFQVDRDIENQHGAVLGKKELFTRPWRYMGAGSERRTFLLSMFDKKSYADHMQVTISWKNAVGMMASGSYRLDAAEFLGFSTLGDPPLPEIAKHLDGLRKAVESVTSGRKDLEVVTETRAQRELRTERNLKAQRARLASWKQRAAAEAAKPAVAPEQKES